MLMNKIVYGILLCQNMKTSNIEVKMFMIDFEVKDYNHVNHINEVSNGVWVKMYNYIKYYFLQ